MEETEIKFNIDWELPFKYLIGPKAVPVPFDFKKLLSTIPIHIPNKIKQQMFKVCMKYLISETDMPVQVETVPHPGYSLIAITFNPKILNIEILEKVMKQILDEIEGTKPTFIPLPEPEVVEADPLDDIDEANVVEFEIDDELKGFRGFFEIEPDHEDIDLSIYGEITEGDETDDD